MTTAVSEAIPAFVAYYIFRYNLYKLVIQRSLVYALSAGIAMVVYLYVVRTFDQFLVVRYSLKPGHNVYQVGGPGHFHSPTHAKSGTFTHTFKVKGTYQFQCTYHLPMKMKVKVE